MLGTCCVLKGYATQKIAFDVVLVLNEHVASISGLLAKEMEEPTKMLRGFAGLTETQRSINQCR